MLDNPNVVAPQIILGVDPGTNVTGYALLRSRGKKLELLTYGVIELARADLDTLGKLRRMLERMISLMDEFKPNVLAIEAPFFGKNVQSMLKLGRAQGVVIAAALVRDLEVYEYAPRKVKKAVTGNGAASKEQVAGVLGHQFAEVRADETHFLLDATDALAVAVCHHYQAFSPGGGAKYSGWGSFVQQNPDRLTS